MINRTSDHKDIILSTELEVGGMGRGVGDFVGKLVEGASEGREVLGAADGFEVWGEMDGIEVMGEMEGCDVEGELEGCIVVGGVGDIDGVFEGDIEGADVLTMHLTSKHGNVPPV